jgi:hypothetical protein
MNYIIRYGGDDKPDKNLLDKIIGEYNVKVVDGSGLPNMGLIELADDKMINEVKAKLTGWNFYPQNKKAFKVPDTRRRIKGK